MDTGQLLLCMLMFLKLWCNSKSFGLRGRTCQLEDNHIGRCMSLSSCVLTPDDSQIIITKSCEAGYICCRVSSKIVTPNNGISVPSLTLSPIIPTAMSTNWVSVPPTIVNAFANGSSGVTSQRGVTTLTTPNPPNSESPPPNEISSPAGSSVSGGSSTDEGLPPSTTSTSSGGSPPPLIGNIVADPWLQSTSSGSSQGDSDTVIVSAELIDIPETISERQCDTYFRMSQANMTQPPMQGGPPRVMIYGGVNSDDKEFPHMAALGYGQPDSKQWLCGGSLLSQSFVITAAHCLRTASLGDVRYVRLGTIYLDQDTQNTLVLNVVRKIAHFQYNPQGYYNDIALLELERMVEITNYVAPICLFPSTDYEDKNLVATGWGKTESGSSSKILQKVGLELFTQTDCQSAYQIVSKQQLPFGIQNSIQLCAGRHSSGGKDTCQGDSGGPLQLRKNNRWYLIGITSIGIKCGDARIPGVYTRVVPYLKWIQKIVWNK